MFFPEKLHYLTPREIQGPWLEVLTKNLSNVQAVVSPSINYQVPSDMVLLLQAAEMDAVPGAGQNISMRQLYIVDPQQLLQHRLKRDDTDLAANAIASLDWQGSIVVLPNWFVVSNADFNAAVAANQVLLNVFGMLMPIGNISRAPA